MSKVNCSREYCRWNKNRICKKPTITLDKNGCTNFKALGLDKISIDKIIAHIKE